MRNLKKGHFDIRVTCNAYDNDYTVTFITIFVYED